MPVLYRGSAVPKVNNGMCGETDSHMTALLENLRGGDH